jgi:oligosaccharide 4-alpha-D-glucosyltransferase
MKARYCLLLLLTAVYAAALAQPKTIKTQLGNWQLTQYAANIIKVNFKPDAYTTAENVSDAVIAKPQLQITIPYTAEGNVVFIGDNKKIAITAPEKNNDSYSFRIALNDDEKIFGGGERALPLNRRGYKFNLYNNPWYGYAEGADNLNYSVPFFTSSNGYGLFFDNASKGFADIGKTTASIFEAGFVSGELNVYVILGNDYKEILAGYHKLTGTQPLPPRWAMGNLMSRFGYTSQQQVTGIVAKMKAQNIPVDAVIFDLFWFGDSIKGTMGNLAWTNKTKWPNPPQMIAGFKKQNINTILITEPFVLQSSSNYNSSKQYHAVDSAGKPYLLTDFYFGKGGIIDIFKKDAQQWFWSKHQAQMKIGVEAWWGDLGEPEKHPSNLYHNLKDKGFKRLFKADEVHNIYGHTWTKMLYDSYAKNYPAKRLFSLNRSGFAGTQRYGIFPWSGDVSRNWSGLRAQLPIMLSMSMSGVPYIHADAGGFAGGEGDNELYTRWLQFAAFTPIFRPHGTALYEVDKNAFSFPSEAALIEEPYRGYAKEVIDLRYRLLPYNYTLAYKQAANGEPLVAPLYYYYPKDTTAVNVGDEFMWGENILVAPVVEKGATERKIYLPEGKWYSFTDTNMVNGNSWINQKLNINHIPAYIKEGSIIPMWIPSPIDFSNTSTSSYTGQKDVSIVYFPSEKPSKGILYNDDGVTKNAVSEIITFDAVQTDNIINITVSSNNAKIYQNGLVKQLSIGVPFSFTYPLQGNLNGKKLEDNKMMKSNFSFNPNTIFNYFNIEFKGQPVKLQIAIHQ